MPRLPESSLSKADMTSGRFGSGRNIGDAIASGRFCTLRSEGDDHWTGVCLLRWQPRLDNLQLFLQLPHLLFQALEAGRRRRRGA